MKTILAIIAFAAIPTSGTWAAGTPAVVAKSYFIDIHEFGPGHVDAAEVAAAHQRDLAVEARHDVRFIEYWIDQDHGRVYCLSEAPGPANITAAHREANGLLPARILAVSPGTASRAVGGRPLFLDIHEFGAGNVAAAAVAGAHQKDLEVEGQFGVNFLNYWVDELDGTVLCLSEAASADQVRATHRQAHGLLPATIVEVKRGSWLRVGLRLDPSGRPCENARTALALRGTASRRTASAARPRPSLPHHRAGASMPTLNELTEREVLALAITSEEEDARIYQTFADQAREHFPASTRMFEDMAAEERGHRDSLYALFRARFGDHLPAVRRDDVRGFLRRKPVWLTRRLPLERMRQEVAVMEMETTRFYERAAAQTSDVAARALFIQLAEVERGHEKKAAELAEKHLGGGGRDEETLVQKRLFVLQYIQPGLTGLIDGSVSTLAPLFAAAFATHSNRDTFLVGLAASLGAGISMGISEAMADDGRISGRGSPWLRGVVCGLMTTIGGLGHTLPYLIPTHWTNGFTIATALAGVVVAIELVVIAWVRTRYMETPFFRSVIQVIAGGALVLAAGAIIGSS